MRCSTLHCHCRHQAGTLELVEADLLGGEAAFAAAFAGCAVVFHCASPFFIEVRCRATSGLL